MVKRETFTVDELVNEVSLFAKTPYGVKREWEARLSIYSKESMKEIIGNTKTRPGAINKFKIHFKTTPAPLLDIKMTENEIDILMSLSCKDDPSSLDFLAENTNRSIASVRGIVRSMLKKGLVAEDDESALIWLTVIGMAEQNLPWE